MIDAVEEDEWVSELKVARLNTSFNAGFIAAKEKLDSTSQMWSHVAESELGHHCRSLRRQVLVYCLKIEQINEFIYFEKTSSLRDIPGDGRLQFGGR